MHRKHPFRTFRLFTALGALWWSGALLGTLTPSLAQADTTGVLSLTAQATTDVPQDVVDITLFYEQEAQDAASLAAALNKHADAALKKAQAVKEVRTHTGSFSIYPMTNRDGRISAWRGRTEVVLESSNFLAASKLAGELSAAMQVGDVAFSLSPETQRAAVEKLTGQAIASFREQADAATRAFGYNSYTIRNVDINPNNVQPRPMMMMALRATPGAAADAAPVPLEGGVSTVRVSVSGSVQMAK